MESSFFHRLTTCEVSVWNLWPVKKHWLSTWQRYKLPITNHNAMGADTIGACEVTATVRTLGISTPPKFLMLLCRPPSSTPCPLKLLMDFLSLETSVHFREFRKESRLQNELYSTRYAGSLAFFHSMILRFIHVIVFTCSLFFFTAGLTLCHMDAHTLLFIRSRAVGCGVVSHSWSLSTSVKCCKHPCPGLCGRHSYFAWINAQGQNCWAEGKCTPSCSFSLLRCWITHSEAFLRSLKYAKCSLDSWFEGCYNSKPPNTCHPCLPVFCSERHEIPGAGEGTESMTHFS